jgi:hypothetical protein
MVFCYIESSRFPSLYFLSEALTRTMIVIHLEQTTAIDASCPRGQESVKKGLGRLQERVFSQWEIFDTQWPLVGYRCRPL